MVVVHVKKGEESLFLYNSSLSASVEALTEGIVFIYNGIKKIKRLCSEIEQLRDFGIIKPDMHSTPEIEKDGKQLQLNSNITDEYEQKYSPKDGYEENIDPLGKRIGRRTNVEMREALNKVIAEARGIVSKETVKSSSCLTVNHIQEAISILRGGVEVVYPHGIPDHDPVRREIAAYVDEQVIEGDKPLDPVTTQLWFASKPLENGKKLSDYFGRNEKTKVVVKLQPRGGGPPPREPCLTDEERKALMMAEFKRREELKKIEEDEDNSYLNSEWADNLQLKKAFHGLENVKWRPH